MDIAEFSTGKRLLVEIYGEMLVHRPRGEAVSLSLYFRSFGVIWDFTQFFSVFFFFSERFVHRFPLSFPFARRSFNVSPTTFAFFEFPLARISLAFKIWSRDPLAIRCRRLSISRWLDLYLGADRVSHLDFAPPSSLIPGDLISLKITR